jgi:hypothetical protein
MDKVKSGIKGMFADYCGGTLQSSVLVVSGGELIDKESREILSIFCDIIASLSRRLRHVRHEDIVDNSVDFLTFDQADIVFLLGKTKSILRTEVLEYLSCNKDPPQIFRIFDFSKPLFERAFEIKKHELNTLNQLIILAGQSCDNINVTSASGTQLEIVLGHDHHWTNSCGEFNGKYPSVFPPGEVNTYSSNVNGVIVCDGAVNSSIGFPRSVLFGDSPFKVKIVNSKIVHYECCDSISALFFKQWQTIDNSMRVGEVGFGTNPGSESFVDFCSHLNERHPGLHLGFGTPTQSAQNVDWSSPIHFDVIPKKTKIYFDNTLVFENQQYLVGALKKLARKNYPSNVLDVDAI